MIKIWIPDIWNLYELFMYFWKAAPQRLAPGEKMRWSR
jgi:hypothetical protein